MKFEKILPLLKSGYKIRREGWSNLDKYYHIKDGIIKNHKGKSKKISYEQMTLNDWEVFEENKTKELWRKDAVITIKTLLDVTEHPKGCFNNKEKLINVQVHKGNMETSTSFEYDKDGKSEVLDFIKRECYL